MPQLPTVKADYLGKVCLAIFRWKDGTGSDCNYVQTFHTSIGNWTVLITCDSVFGVYYAASFLALDPWYMFTSYLEYLLVASSYINILNVYAFSNWHDVSWAEKPSKEVEAVDMLPSAVLGRVSGLVQQSHLVSNEGDKPQIDIDQQFEETVKRALRPYVKTKVADKRRSVDESFKSFRTKQIYCLYLFKLLALCVCYE